MYSESKNNFSRRKLYFKRRFYLFKTVNNISEKELRNFQLAIYNLYPNGNSRSIGPVGNRRTSDDINKYQIYYVPRDNKI